jgi:cellulose synthase/poly-beta-1,6-N-acetylglucosamine synthase-like glycosyltransferase
VGDNWALSIDMQPILLGMSVAVSILFFPYGLNFYLMIRKAQDYNVPTKKADERFPVTIQLPVFNERYVVERLLNACARMADRYGRDLVQILLLDDSTDETTQIAYQAVERLRRLGYDVSMIHREIREGFKAGALQNALKDTKHSFVAIFDADFVPPFDFLDKCMPYFSDTKLSLVQCRWTHLNRLYNMVTSAVSIGYDGHHLVEQTGRTAAGYLLNFNGSAGVLRREALEDAGGWQADTLAEDLDASYRMQLKGWNALYLRDIECPAEIPPTIPSLKRQQGRWARGSIRTFRKLFSRILVDKKLSLGQKAEALVHLSYYSVHPLMFAAYAIALIAAFLGVRLVNLAQFLQVITIQTPGAEPNVPDYMRFMSYLQPTLEAAWNGFISMPHWIILNATIVFCSISMWVFYAYALKLQGVTVRSQFKTLAALGLIGFGISVSNTIAVAQGFLSKTPGTFSRTPKYKIEKRGDSWRDKKYQVNVNKTVALEILFGALGIVAMIKSAADSNFGIIPILFTYTVAYLYISRVTFRDALRVQALE